MSQSTPTLLIDPAPGVRRVEVGSGACDLTTVRDAVGSNAAGAIVVFEGVTREVEALEYEAYAQMAAEQIVTIATKALAETGACAAAIGHEVGLVPLGRPSVVIAVSAPHRGEAFTAARQIIDELKLLAPIWKLEIEGTSRTRVDGTTPQPAGDLAG